MRNYSEAEKCMLLLFAPLGVERPLSRRAYQGIAKAIAALGSGDGGSRRDVTRRDLERLGASEEDAGCILDRLEQEDVLEQYLRKLRGQGITPLTRVTLEYPRRLRQVLGSHASMLLYCAGNLRLFETECVSLVGSRQLRMPGWRFAQTLGRTAALERLTYVSGGAAGADTAGYEGAIENGGRAIVFVADSLEKRMEQERTALESGRLLLVSEYGPDQPFSAQRAHSRNRLIHAMGQKTFVAQSDYGSGGTWNGVLENLEGGWSPVFMCNEEPENLGTRTLIERGCQPIRTVELKRLRELGGSQMRLF